MTKLKKKYIFLGQNKEPCNGRTKALEGHSERGKEALAIKIDDGLLEQACKEIIETILFCLPNAYKGTVYLIGNPPKMIAKRITSGIIDEERKIISWGLPERSEYNPPGKHFVDYRDQPGRPSEAMAWCVEKQKSWTAEDPKNDSRSVRLQVEGSEGSLEDFHHMEPVLVRKDDLYAGNGSNPEDPRSSKGEIIWENCDYVVVGVIKIHFQPNTIKKGSPETRVIKRLSRSLGTELLSYQLRQHSLDAMSQLAKDKLQSCNILADSLRNAITKSGLIFSLIKLELGFVREQWEQVLLRQSDLKEMKREAVLALNSVLKNMTQQTDELAVSLVGIQNKFLYLSLPPEQGKNWVSMQIEDKWNELLYRKPVGEEQTKEIRQGIDQLKQSLYLGSDPEILATYSELSESLKKEWVDLIYSDTDQVDSQFLDRLIRFLGESPLNLPYQEKSRKGLIRLKALAEIMGQLEQSTNIVLTQVLNGNGNGMILNPDKAVM